MDETQPDAATKKAAKKKTTKEEVRVECSNCSTVVNRKFLKTHKESLKCQKKRKVNTENSASPPKKRTRNDIDKLTKSPSVTFRIQRRIA